MPDQVVRDTAEPESLQGAATVGGHHDQVGPELGRLFAEVRTGAALDQAEFNLRAGRLVPARRDPGQVGCLPTPRGFLEIGAWKGQPSHAHESRGRLVNEGQMETGVGALSQQRREGQSRLRDRGAVERNQDVAIHRPPVPRRCRRVRFHSRIAPGL
jgi:hypothetical protein